MRQVPAKAVAQDLSFGAVTVSFNSAETLPNLFSSLETLALKACVIVDSASTDESADLAEAWDPPFARRVVRAPNGGFAAAVNIGYESLSAIGVDVLLLLNPDCRVIQADLDSLADRLRQRPSLGSLCPVLLSEDLRTIDSLGLRLTPWASPADTDQGRPATEVRVGQIEGVIGPTGGGAVYRMAALRSVRGPLDSSYFLYLEDADLALRLGRAGWKTETTPLMTVSHRRGGLGGVRRPGTGGGVPLALRARQESYRRFVSQAPLPRSQRLLGKSACAIRGLIVKGRLRSLEGGQTS